MNRKRWVFRRRAAILCALGLLLQGGYLLLPRDGLLPFCHRLYINGQIQTLNVQNDIANAMLVSCGRVEWIGDQQDARQLRRWYTRTVDLEGRSVVPGFVDAHSHFPLSGLSDVALDLNSSPAGSTDSLSRLYQKLQQQAQAAPPGEWIFGFNYDNTVFRDGQHPDRKSLDAISSKHPIFVRHISGHMGVVNSSGLAELGVTGDPDAATNPYVGKYSQSSELNGLLQESAAPSLSRFVRSLAWSKRWLFYRSALRQYASAGFTTVQAGGISANNAQRLGWLSRFRLLPLRLVYWINHGSEGYTLSDGNVESAAGSATADYLLRSAVKLYADGSPQGFTAYLSRPYHTRAPGAELTENTADYRGYPGYQSERWAEFILHYWRRQIPLAIHVNGDAAIADVLNGVAQVQQDYPTLQRFPITLVHAQTLRQDQASLAAQLGIEASFFISHTYYWGDWHAKKSLGPERAENISPLKWAEDAGLRYTLHSDAPVTPTSAIQMLWNATTRQTRSGRILGAHQRVSRLSALRALTIEAARQAGVGEHRGSLEVGKAADFVVLSDDPLSVGDVRHLQIMQTVVGGKTVYAL